MKRILPARAQDEGFIKMLVNEAKLTVQLTHSNIAQIYECGRIDGNYFISMELVNGVSMKEMMQRLLPRRTGDLAGAGHLHRAPAAHGARLRAPQDRRAGPAAARWSTATSRPTTPSSPGRARSSCSTSASRAPPPASPTTRRACSWGSSGTSRPSRPPSSDRWDHRVDLFAAGIILYELLTKQKPFPRATDVDSLIPRAAPRWCHPPPSSRACPRSWTPILTRALAYDPDNRFADARSFADALVDALFPTPHSAIQDLLGMQMKSVFAERIARQRAARAHDALIMKVLANVADQQAQAEYERLSALSSAPTAPEAVSDAEPLYEPHVAPAPSELPTTEPSRPSRRASRPRTVIREGVRLSTAVGVALLLAVAGATGLHFGEIRYRPGLLVVTSEPAGAQVTLDGDEAGVTPAVLEGVWLSRPHELTLVAPGTKPSTVTIEPQPGKPYRRVHVKLENAMGALRVESEPPGAQVRIDDRQVGTTPVTVPGVRMDERHRIDLTMTGYEEDQVVVLPEKDGESGGTPAGQGHRQGRGAVTP